jgi:hypothetical protein
MHIPTVGSQGGAVSNERGAPVCAAAADGSQGDAQGGNALVGEQKYLAHKKQPPPQEPPQGPTHIATVGPALVGERRAHDGPAFPC